VSVVVGIVGVLLGLLNEAWQPAVVGVALLQLVVLALLTRGAEVVDERLEKADLVRLEEAVDALAAQVTGQSRAVQRLLQETAAPAAGEE
jgi:hypothetical protein